MKQQTKRAILIQGAMVIVLVAVGVGIYVISNWGTDGPRCLTVEPDNANRLSIERHIKATKPDITLDNLYFELPDDQKTLDGNTIYAGRLSNGNVGIWTNFTDLSNINHIYSILNSENAYAATVSGLSLSYAEHNKRIMSLKATDRVFKCASEAR